MSRRPPPFRMPLHSVAGESAPDTEPTAPPGLAPDLGDGDTIAVPLGSADTLPCPRLTFDDLPTLRASPSELAALIALSRPTRSPSLDLAPSPRSTSNLATNHSERRPAGWPPRVDERFRPADRKPAVRMADAGQTVRNQRAPASADTLPVLAVTQLPQRLRSLHPGPPQMPTQLWLAPVVQLAPERRAPRSWWARLGSLLGFTKPVRPGSHDRYPGYHRQELTRR